MLTEIKGMTERRYKLISKMGIRDIYDLLSFIPKKYIDMGNLCTISSCVEGELSVLKVRIVDKPKVRYIRKNMSIVEMKVTDGAYMVECYWFNQPYIAQKSMDKEYYLIGKVSVINGKRRFSSPALEPVEGVDEGIIPIYSLIKGLRQKEFRTLIKNSLEYARTHKALLNFEYNGMDIYNAFEQIHFPNSEETKKTAMERIKYDEAVYLSCAFNLLERKGKAHSITLSQQDYDEFISRLPFTMTDGQINAAREIFNDMNTTMPMNRLLQGNVGCGKTIVALFSIYANCKNGYQAAFMAPTEVLAYQNYQVARKYLHEFNIAYLTGSTSLKEKRTILEQLNSGQIDVIVGTHSLIKDNIEFKCLNLTVTDEQHRFGVKQRAKLSNRACHTLIMSATPIPRTLALIAFKKLNLSIINEMPKDREPVETHIIYPNKRMDMYRFIVDKCKLGEQAYIVCPLIDASESLESKSVKDIYKELTDNVLKGINTGILHGRMKSEEKEKVLGDFRDGKIQVLISTTVIEVGVDIKNATIMVIENCDRFGLAALHQLRGRVGRGVKKSYCFAVSYALDTVERLQVFKQTTDGYKIALMDLSQRGIGELTGVNQHGGNVLKFLDLINDKEMLEMAEEYIASVKSSEKYNQIKAYTLRIYDDILEDIILN